MTRTAIGMQSSTSYTKPIDKQKMREQRLELYDPAGLQIAPRTAATITASMRVSRSTRPIPGMGADINVHDQWAVESMGRIQDRTPRTSRLVRQGPSSPIVSCCGRKSRRSPAVSSRPCSSTQTMARSIQGPGTMGRHRSDPRLGKPTGWKSMVARPSWSAMGSAGAERNLGHRGRVCRLQCDELALAEFSGRVR